MFSFLSLGSWQLDLFLLKEGRHTHAAVNDNYKLLDVSE